MQMDKKKELVIMKETNGIEIKGTPANVADTFNEICNNKSQINIHMENVVININK